MVDSIVGNAMRSVLQSQNQAQSGGMVALKSSAKATDAIIDQLQQTVEQGKALMKQTAMSKIAPASNLPRGSLVNILV
jgi:hypothetical protein